MDKTPGGEPGWDFPENSFLARLAPTERRLLRDAGTMRRFAAEDVICRQGEPLRHVMVLITGRVQITVQASSSYEAVVAVRGAGDIVGELAAVDSRPRSATVRAIDDVAMVMVPWRRFTVLCQQRPALTWAVLHVVVGKLRELTAQNAEYGGSTVASRLATLLVELADQHGTTSADGISINLPYSQAELAAMVSGSRESVVRALRVLRAKGILTTARRRITIRRLDWLREQSTTRG